jgi:uncharacterized protein
MKIIGNAQFAAEPDVVYRALNDPSVLVRCIPGCHRLEALGDDLYKMTVAAGVGSIKGVYDGQVRLTDQQPPGSFRMHAEGAGAAGTIGADVQVTLGDGENGGTSLTYDADAVVGGMIGGVGQRVLSGVAKKTAGEFFAAVDDVLSGRAPNVPAPREETAGPVAASPAPGVFTAPPAPARTGLGGDDFVRGAVFGAVVALAGVLVGGLVARRRQP